MPGPVHSKAILVSPRLRNFLTKMWSDKIVQRRNGGAGCSQNHLVFFSSQSETKTPGRSGLRIDLRDFARFDQDGIDRSLVALAC